MSLIETKTEKALREALEALDDVQFIDNTYTEGADAKRQVERIMELLAQKLDTGE